MSLNTKSKGFLFTISIIMFASTLLFFAQTYSTNNALNEKQVIISSKPVFVHGLIDDISFDLLRLFDTSIQADGNGIILITGSVSGDMDYSSILSLYSTHLADNLFPSAAWVESVDLSALSDGSAEINFGDNYIFKNNYSAKSIMLLPRDGFGGLSSIDLNISAGQDLNSYAWTSGPVAGGSTMNFSFIGDSNSFSLSEELDLNSVSTLVLFFDGDSNITITFGQVSTGEDAGIEFFTSSTERIEYSLGVDIPDNIMPVEWNSLIEISGDKFDSNSLIPIYK